MEMKEHGVVNTGFRTQDEGMEDAYDTQSRDEKDTQSRNENDSQYRDASSVNVYIKNPNSTTINGDVDVHAYDEIEYDKTGDIILRKRKVDSEANACVRVIDTVQEKLSDFYRDNKKWIWRGVGIILLILYIIYFAFAMDCGRLKDEGSVRLLACTCLGIVLLVLYLTDRVHQPVRAKISYFLNDSSFTKVRMILRWVLYVLSLCATVTVLIVLVAIDNADNLLSLAGLAAFVVICFLTSHSPSMVNWHPVYWGFTIQFYFAALILKTKWGYETFKWLGDRITEFLSYSDEGAKFVFGDFAELKRSEADGGSLFITAAYEIHFFAFKVMPVVTFFSTVISVLYYLGIMQKIISVIGRFLSFCLGTTPAESLNAAGNIFVAMTESPLMIKPFLGKMTSSELHAVMTGGFATIAGSVLGAYISFGVPADHLLSASVMSAPAALAISKLTYPEVEEPIVKPTDYDKKEKPQEKNVIEAACNGAIISAKIIASILVNVIAFLSLLKLINATLIWFGDRVGKDDFTFEYICSYVLYPVALFMGTALDDCRRVAELIGIKTFTNEFIAYRSLADLIDNRKRFEAHIGDPSNSWRRNGDDIILFGASNAILRKGILEPRSELIATYALCGFSNFGSMGILLGGLTALAPHRKPTMSRLIFRAMIMGNVACFFTACIAGLFYEKFD